MEYSNLASFHPNTSEELMAMYGDGSYAVDQEVYGLTEDLYVPGSEHYVEGFGDTEFHETHTILADGGDRFGVSALAFDQQEELLWMGNQGGHVTSYYGRDMQKYTSFQVHANQEVRHIHTFGDGILALTQSALRCQIRRGLPVFTHVSDNMQDMQCQLQISPDTMLMGGHQEKLIEFNLNQGRETNLIEVGKDGCAILRLHGKFICAGDPSGKIKLRDKHTLRVEHTLDVYSGSLSDFDIHGNTLVTCGFSNRHGALSMDRFLKVYDLRMMRATNPIQVIIDPILLRFMPSFSSRVAVVSTLGQMQLVDTVALSQSSLCLYQSDTAGSVCASFDVSPSCQCLALGDTGGSIHLYASSPPSAKFNSFARETEFADPVEPLPPIDIRDFLTPLSTIPLPYCHDGTWLSDWPEQFLKKVYRPTPPIDQEILRTMKMQGTIGYAPNPPSRLRNQVAYKVNKHDSKPRTRLFPDAQSQKNQEVAFIAIPKRYRKADFKYKFGFDDFDFEMFNKTGLCGLEATLPNSYCNSMIQVLYYLAPMRNVLISHVCQKEFCLACELGFLFHMLHISKGTPCQASNFLRAFRTVPEASALGLILSDQDPDSRKKSDLIHLIQSWNRFILHQIHNELLETKKRKALEQASQVTKEGFVYREQDFPSIFGHIHSRLNSRVLKARNISEWIDGGPPREREEEHIDENGQPLHTEDTTSQETEISHLFGTKQNHIHKCLKCGVEVGKESMQLICNLLYPDMNSGEVEHAFGDILARSLCPERTTPAWCETCKKYRPTLQSKRIVSLPNILALNCGFDKQQAKKDKLFWQTQMDLIVQKVLDPSVPQPSSQKPCRYGLSCSRPDCRFKHSDRQETNSSASNNHVYYTHSWLPLHLKVDLLNNGSLSASKTSYQTVVEEISKDVQQRMIYDLAAVVCYVDDRQNFEKRNLVALINIPQEYRRQSSDTTSSQWYLFNDLSVSPVPAQEVIWYNLEWKIPCILYWVNRHFPPQLMPPLFNPLTLEVFGEDKCLAQDGRKMITFTPLTVDEIPGRGDIVAMDAEFVTLNQVEAELRSDGKMSTIKPSHMSVARITCIRGQGPMEGVPFIDDYISTQEQVVDYLTKFSGISPGDLDANFSSKHLTTLKSTYQKLRFLIDSGVKFVGHGLKNDFRVINLVVPPEQIIDTVYLFHLPHHRMVSLRFLAWHFLGLKIQSVTHDSIEDARTALQLYKCYQRMLIDNTLEITLKELYEAGNRLQWKVPGIGIM